ncbi:MAG: hypothetical protein EGR14_07905 [Barnesiella intestinihominis]|nr:hypothetical protein [Barnesiella intestinihominis]
MNYRKNSLFLSCERKEEPAGHKKQMNLFYSAPAFHYFCNTIAGAYLHLVRSPHRQTKHTK